jgi:hypothetical protein
MALEQEKDSSRLGKEVKERSEALTEAFRRREIIHTSVSWSYFWKLNTPSRN